MTDQQLTTALEDLKANAERLNAASNEINSIIESVERQIAASHVGLEHWLELGCTFTGRNGVPVADDGYKYYDRRLGWAKVGEHWRLALLTKSGAYNPVGESIGTASDIRIESLASASRPIRIAALEKLPTLISALAQRALEETIVIEEAKKLIS